MKDLISTINHICLILFLFHLLFSSSISKSTLINHHPIFVYENFRETYRPPTILSKTKSQSDLLSISWLNSNDITSNGIDIHFTLGSSLRHHYISKLSFLSPIFNPKEIKAISYPSNQNIFTTYSHLLGLYSPPFGGSINPEFVKGTLPGVTGKIINNIYQDLSKSNTNSNVDNKAAVFPISTYSNDSDIYDVYSKCTKIHNDKEDDTMKEMMNKFKDSYQTKLGLNDSLFTKWENIVKICETVVLDDNEGKINSLINKTDINILRSDCDNINHVNIYEHILKEEKTVLYSVSNLVRYLITQMDEIINNKSSQEKYLINSSNEIDMAAMIKFISLYVNEENKVNVYPSFDKSLIIELAYNDDNKNDLLINIFCGKNVLVNNMKYETFKKKVMNNIYSQNKVNGYCDIGKLDQYEWVYILTTFLSIAIGGVLVYFVVKQVKSLKNKKKKNENINERDELWKQDDNENLIFEE